MERLAQTDSDLLAALRASDEAALGRLVDDLSPGLARMALLYVSTEAAADDLDQMRDTIVALGELCEDSISAEGRTELVEAFGDWKRPA